MKNIKNFKAQIIYLCCTVFLSGIFYISGCSSDTVTNPPPPTSQDSNVVIYDSILILEHFDSLSLSAVDLYQGKIIEDKDRNKDIVMRDSAGVGLGFFLRSGDQSTLDVIGYRCVFNVYNGGAIYTKQNFDTLSRMWGLGDTLNVTDFPETDTQLWGLFNATTNQGRIYEVYLEGKFLGSITPHQVFGLVYLKEGSSGGPAGYTQVISVKLNVGGHNHFVK